MPRGHNWSSEDERLLFGILVTLVGTANYRKAAELLREVHPITVSNEAVHHRFREVRSAYERQLEGVRRAFSGESASVTPFNTTAPINESGFVASSSNNDMAGTSTAIQPGLTMQQENYFQYDFHIDPELWSGSPLQYIPDTAASFQNPYVANAYPVAPEPKRKAEHGELEPKDEVPSSKRARRE